MSKDRNTQAGHLGDLLFTLQGQQQSGLLSAEQSQEGRLEEGEIYLLAGQLIYAHTGKLAGLEALRYLLTWRSIHFSFLTDAPRPPANLPARITIQGPLAPNSPRTPPTCTSTTNARSHKVRPTSAHNSTASA